MSVNEALGWDDTDAVAELPEGYLSMGKLPRLSEGDSCMVTWRPGWGTMQSGNAKTSLARVDEHGELLPVDLGKRVLRFTRLGWVRGSVVSERQREGQS